MKLKKLELMLLKRIENNYLLAAFCLLAKKTPKNISAVPIIMLVVRISSRTTIPKKILDTGTK